MWERGLEPDVLPVARELGVGVVSFAPLGRGFLTGAIPAGASFDPDDRRANDPWQAGENPFRNQSCCRCCVGWRSTEKLPPAQIALAWLLAQGDDMVPIPGAEKVTYVEQASRRPAAAAGADQPSPPNAVPLAIACSPPRIAVYSDPSSGRKPQE